MQALLEEYRRSLKMPAAEERLDLILYRPVAFVVVKAIYRLPITPNAVTGLSLIAGLIAAWEFSAGGLVAAAAWYVAANILDCSDGQLARLQNSGTPLGRLVDGIADYISSVAIFLGIGIGLARTQPEYWWLVVAAGLSSALHAIVFDRVQSEFIATVRGEENFVDRELNRFAPVGAEVRDSRSKPHGPITTFFISMYVRYLLLQRRSVGGQAAQRSTAATDRERYRLTFTPMMRSWTLLGPTTNRSLLIVCALAGRPELFLWIVATIGNAWLGVCLMRQRALLYSPA